MDMLNAVNLQKIYHARLGGKSTQALNGVSFTVQAGEYVAIMGASGSGKSTLLNILATLDKPTGGELTLQGVSLKDIKGKDLAAFRRNNLGFVFQDFNLLDTFTVRDNILLPLVLNRVSIDEMEKRLKPLVQQLGIEKLLSQYPYEISGGEKQRTAVARAIITQPKILLADEPTGALDSRSSQQLMDIFNSLSSQGQTLLMVTHSTLAASYAQRVLFIQDGKLFAELCRGDQVQHAFYDRIVSTLSVLMGQGGEAGV